MSSSGTESLTLPIIGMTCASCQHHVESALKETSGVKSAHVDLMANRASVVFDPAEASADGLIAAIRGAGYDAVLPHPGAAVPKVSEASYGQAEVKATATLIAGAIAMLLTMPFGGQMGPVDQVLMRLLPWLYAVPPDIVRWMLLIVTAVLMAWAGTRYLCCRCPRPAARQHQYEYPGEPGDRRGIPLLRICHDRSRPGSSGLL